MHEGHGSLASSSENVTPVKMASNRIILESGCLALGQRSEQPSEKVTGGVRLPATLL